MLKTCAVVLVCSVLLLEYEFLTNVELVRLAESGSVALFTRFLHAPHFTLVAVLLWFTSYATYRSAPLYTFRGTADAYTFLYGGMSLMTTLWLICFFGTGLYTKTWVSWFVIPSTLVVVIAGIALAYQWFVVWKLGEREYQRMISS